MKQVETAWSASCGCPFSWFYRCLKVASLEISGMTFYRIVNGRVVEQRGVADVLGLMLQLDAFS